VKKGVSSPLYFAGVALVSALLLGAAMALRPGFAYSVREAAGLVKPSSVGADSFFALRVAPVFETHCSACHGERRQKGGLRLDGFDAAMRGGKHGPVLHAGNADGSELLKRILLPQTDPKAMPPQGKEPLSADDISLVRLWIAGSASPTLQATAFPGAPAPKRKIEVPAVDEAAVERARAPFAAAFADLHARYPAAIAFVSRGSADLEINAALLGHSFGNDDLAKLAPVSGRIVRLDLTGTAVTDSAAVTLAGMSRLQTLRILNTRVTASSLAPLRARGVKVYDGTF
jgi:mono/diheme cytochrome c family protein